MSNNTIAIITARGGSKRIPRKNIKSFCGKPIIEYSIKAALDSGIFDEVMVSTDDKEIAEVALRAGANVPFFRSDENSNDYATTSDVLKEVIGNYMQKGQKFDYACCIYPTAPFVTSAKLINAFQKLVQEKWDSVMPVTAFSFPPLRGMVFHNDCLKYKWEEYAMARSQDLEEIYHDCGQFYFFDVERFLESGRLVTDNTTGIIVSELEVQDIDNETDWKIAEMKYNLLQEEGRSQNENRE